jgi:hypothetical protein
MKHELIGFLYVVSSFMLVLFMSNPALVAEETTDVEKLYAEIVGVYESESGGQANMLTFRVKDGILMARNPKDDDEVPLKPVAGNELAFKIEADEEHTFEITFSRDENGKVTKCLLEMMGMKFEYTRRPEKTEQ